MAQTFAQKLKDVKNKLAEYKINCASLAAPITDPQDIRTLNIQLDQSTQTLFDYIEKSFLLDINGLKNIYGAENIEERTYAKDLPDISKIYIPANMPMDQFTGLNPIRAYAALKEDHHPNSGEYNLYQIFAREMKFIEDNQQYLAYSVATVTRLKKALDAVSDGRIADAITIVRDAKRDDPHNNTLAFVLSQLCYYRSRNGMTEFLPEARNEGKKSCHFSDDANQYMLRLYRYAYVINEFSFDKEKSLELMRNFYLLNPEAMTEKDGILAHNGIHAKAWLLLSRIDDSLWNKFEHESLKTLATSAPGGAIFYFNFFHKIFKNKFTEGMTPELEAYKKVEERLAITKQKYRALTDAIKDSFTKEGKLKDAPARYWTLQHRYITTFLNAVEAPNLDQILMHCSLDARKYARNCYQNEALKTQGLAGTNYWQAWGMSINADPAMSSKSIIPAAAVSLAIPIMKAMDELVNLLKEHEESVIDSDKWEIIKPYMPDYQYHAFIHVGAGPKAFRSPEDPYYLPLFRKWSSQPPEHPMPSIIMHKHGTKGAFTSLDEAVAAFEGIARIIDDPIHGLKSRAKAALKVLVEDKERHQQETKLIARRMLMKSHFNDFWWLYFIILPIAIITFLVMVSSGSTAAAFNNLAIMLLFVAGFIAITYVFSSKKSKPTEEETDADVDDFDQGFEKLEELSKKEAEEHINQQ